MIQTGEKTARGAVAKVSAFVRRTLDPKTKTLIKAGYVDECLRLTSTGREELEAISAQTHLDALVSSARESLKKNGDDNDDQTTTRT